MTSLVASIPFQTAYQFWFNKHMYSMLRMFMAAADGCSNVKTAQKHHHMQYVL